MKFLDNFIQPRKSYRNVGMFPVGASALQHMFDGNDSSRSSGSAKLTANVTVTTTNGNGKNDVDGVLSQFYHMNQFGHGNLVVKREEDCTNGHVPTMGDGQTNMPSSSSSIVSQESMAAIHGNCSLDDSIQMRKRRRTINNGNGEDVQSTNGLTNTNRLLAKDRLKSDDEGDDELEAEDEDDRHINDNNASARQSTPIPPEFLYSFYQQQHRQLHMQQQKLQQQQQTPPPPSPNMPRLRSKPPSTEQLDTSASTFSNPGDFLHSLYQQTAMARQTRSSEQLLGELVTSELLKMSKERKRIVQKKILEILFFDDDWLLHAKRLTDPISISFLQFIFYKTEKVLLNSIHSFYITYKNRQIIKMLMHFVTPFKRWRSNV